MGLDDLKPQPANFLACALVARLPTVLGLDHSQTPRSRRPLRPARLPQIWTCQRPPVYHSPLRHALLHPFVSPTLSRTTRI
jgi:hypothetical protein